MWPLLALAAVKSGYDMYHSKLDRQAESQKELYSPWTGHQDQDPGHPNVAGNFMAAYGAGSSMDQNQQAIDAYKQSGSNTADSMNSQIDAASKQNAYAQPVPGGFQQQGWAQPDMRSKMGDYNFSQRNYA